MDNQLSLRDQFAMAAITGAAVDGSIQRWEKYFSSLDHSTPAPKDEAEAQDRFNAVSRMARETFASRAYEIADAMMEFRKKESEARNAADVEGE